MKPLRDGMDPTDAEQVPSAPEIGASNCWSRRSSLRDCPNGFLRAFRGSLSGRNKANVTVRSRYGARGEITLDVQNHRQLSAAR
jgi:hypothetical protein